LKAAHQRGHVAYAFQKEKRKRLKRKKKYSLFLKERGGERYP